MSKGWAALASFLFVVIFAGVLAIPVLQVGDEPEPDTAVVVGPTDLPTPTPEETPAPEPSPTPDPTPEPESDVVGRFPPQCLEGAVAPPPTGLLATAGDDAIVVSSLDGGRVTDVSGAAPLGWSPSGRYLAHTGLGDPGEVWVADGAVDYGARRWFRARVDAWAWVPTHDCLLGSNDEGLWIARRGGSGGFATKLLDAHVADFAVSLDGRYLAVVTQEKRKRSLRVLDPALMKTRFELSLPSGSSALRLYGFATTDTVLYGYLRTGTDQGLHAANIRTDETRKVAPAAPDDGIEPCGTGYVYSSDGTIWDGTTAEARPLTASGEAAPWFQGATCPAGGQYVAALRAPTRDGAATQLQLTLLARSGSPIRPLSPGGAGASDVYADWRSGTGIVFLRGPQCLNCTSTGVWAIPEGGVPRPLGVTVTRPQGPAASAWAVWRAAFDWSATAPDGIPLRR